MGEIVPGIPEIQTFNLTDRDYYFINIDLPVLGWTQNGAFNKWFMPYSYTYIKYFKQEKQLFRKMSLELRKNNSKFCKVTNNKKTKKNIVFLWHSNIQPETRKYLLKNK